MTEYERVAGTLKKILKTRRVTYSALARRLGLSESGVKKILNARDASFERIASIASVIEVPIVRLLGLAAEPGIQEVELTPDQEKLLFENRDTFRFYWKLTIERVPLSKLRKALSEKEVRRHLSRLDRIGLIRLEPGDRMRISHTGPIRWVSSGPLMRWLLSEWSIELARECADRTKAAGYLHRLSFLRLTSESERELHFALARLVDEFAKRSDRESLIHDAAGLKPVSLLVALAPHGFVSEA